MSLGASADTEGPLGTVICPCLGPACGPLTGPWLSPHPPRGRHRGLFKTQVGLAPRPNPELQPIARLPWVDPTLDVPPKDEQASLTTAPSAFSSLPGSNAPQAPAGCLSGVCFHYMAAAWQQGACSHPGAWTLTPEVPHAPTSRCCRPCVSARSACWRSWRACVRPATSSATSCWRSRRSSWRPGGCGCECSGPGTRHARGSKRTGDSRASTHLISPSPTFPSCSTKVQQS